MTATEAAPFLFRLAAELERWADASARLEQATGALAARVAPTASDLAALQELDALTQHLRVLSRLLTQVAPRASAAGLQQALDGLELDALRLRLSGAPDGEPAAGRVELW